MFRSNVLSHLLLGVLIVGIVACNGNNEPTSVAEANITTPIPTETPAPIATVDPPTITVRPDPNTDVALMLGEELPLQVDATSTVRLTIEWKLQGPGQLSEDKTQPSVIYIAPATLETGKTAIVSVVVQNEGGQTTQSITISLVEPTATPTFTATPSTPTPTSTPSPDTDFVTLTYPTNGAEVPCENTAEGEYGPGLEGEIWPIVYIDGRFYPQDANGNPASKLSGEWFQTVRFGGCASANDLARDTGKVFELFVMVANDACHAVTTEYFEIGDFSGWTELPESCQENVPVHIRVTRTAAAR